VNRFGGYGTKPSHAAWDCRAWRLSQIPLADVSGKVPSANSDLMLNLIRNDPSGFLVVISAQILED